MAFAMSNAASSPGAFGVAQVQEGPELPEIQTDQIGFSSYNGEAKVQLLPSSWPVDALPPPTSSLLTVASSTGWIAAAGPDALILTTTESVRKAFRVDERDGRNVRPLQPDIKLSLPNLAQVAFSADENVLVVSSQAGGGLAAYKMDDLKNEKIDPALQIPTNNTALRALIPNPASESAELFTAITSNGQLLMADLKSGQLKSGANGPILKTGASCSSWSNKGKQLVVGLADGNAVQMKPDGTIVAEIPRSASLPPDVHMSSISWLENDSFFAVYTTNDSTADGPMPPSEYYIISRQPKTSNFTFQKLPEICPPFGMNRLPSFHFVTRLRNFPPSLEDLLVVASTTAIDIGLLSKSRKPLSKEEPVTDIFTLTAINDDTKRAQLPLSTSMGDTSPIGMALDLSSTEMIGVSIPSDPEISQSHTPVPNLLVLDNEGVLSSWWIIYNDSIKEKVMFSGFDALAIAQKDQMQTSFTLGDMPAQAMSPSTVPDPTTRTNETPFAKADTSGFGASAASTDFGSPANTFGTPTTIGGKPSWTSTGFGGSSAPQSQGPGFGQPAFGTPASMGTPRPPAFGATAFGAPAFGSASSMGNRPSPLGQAATSSSSIFGQSGALGRGVGTAFGGGSSASPFAAAAAAGGAKSSGFASFSNNNGFSGFGSAKGDGDNVFAKQSSIFGANPNGLSPFGSGKPIMAGGSSGAPNTGFKLESTFKPDGTAKDDLPKPSSTGDFTFGNGFRDMLGETRNGLSPTHDKEAEMDDTDDEPEDRSSDGSVGGNMRLETTRTTQPLVTPPSTIIQHKATPAPPLSSLFGTGFQNSTTPVSSQNTNSGWTFGGVPSTTPKDTPASSHTTLFSTSANPEVSPAVVQPTQPKSIFSTASSSGPGGASDLTSLSAPATKTGNDAPQIKAEPPSDDDSEDLKNIPEAPLPPDPTSKPNYSPGDTSSSSDNSRTVPDDAPLPPDFIPANKSAVEGHGGAELPPEDDELSSDFEGSGEDVTQELSPIDDSPPDQTEQLLTSPESSFGRGGDKSADQSPTGGLFTKVSTTNLPKSHPRQLFGEIGAGPVFAPPKPQESPRSPSPVRNVLVGDLLRPEAPRSFSAPQNPSVIEKRRVQIGKSGLGFHAIDDKESLAKEQARKDAIAKAKAQREAEEAQQLEDDEDERLRAELREPVAASERLDPFLPYQSNPSKDVPKLGIPGQIERLYQDINLMIDTLGINARSLSAFILYQQGQKVNPSWPDVLKSQSPMETLQDEWLLQDIARLHEGDSVLDQVIEDSKISNVANMLYQCQSLLAKDIADLRSKLTNIRKTLKVRSDASLTVSAPLSTEQATIQHDLRKASSNVQTSLRKAEETLTVLRAKLAEVTPSQNGGSSRGTGQKKPTVEAVTNTVSKMTSMAEKKSSNIDVLEAQLKRLNLDFSTWSNNSRQKSDESNGTPEVKRLTSAPSPFGLSTGSPATSIYQTPNSKFGGSTKSTPGSYQRILKSSRQGGMTLVSANDKQRWQMKAEQKKKIAAMVKEALMHRQKLT